MKFFKRKWVLLILLLSLLGPLVFVRQNQQEHSKLLQTVLNLKELPGSVKAVDCEKWGQSGLLITCYFECDHQELAEIMKGRKFARMEKATGSSFDDAVSGGPTRGKEFTVAHGWISKSGLKENDWIRLHTDSSKGQAITDIYIE